MSVLGDLRDRVAQALDGGEVAVHREVVESLEPPCYLLSWGQPMLEQLTACNFTARPAVVCVGGRLNAPEGYGTIEQLLQDAIVRVRRLNMPIDLTEQITILEVGGVSYLTSRLTLRTTVTIT